MDLEKKINKKSFFKHACKTIKYAGAIGVLSATMSLMHGCTIPILYVSEVPVPCKKVIEYRKDTHRPKILKKEKSSASSHTVEFNKNIEFLLNKKPEIPLFVAEHVEDDVSLPDVKPEIPVIVAESAKERVYLPGKKSKIPSLVAEHVEDDVSLPDEKPEIPVIVAEHAEDDVSLPDEKPEIPLNLEGLSNQSPLLIKKLRLNKYSALADTGNPSEEQNPSKSNSFNWTGIALNLFTAVGSFFVFRYFLNKAKSISFASLKKTHDLLVSLPELSRPGISEENVYSLLRQHAKDISPVVLKKLSVEFIDVLCDKNAFSRLELMILANTMKNTYNCKHDIILYTGLCRVLINYNREALEFNDLLDSIKDSNIKQGYSKLAFATQEIKELLEELNKASNDKNILKYRDAYTKQLGYAKKQSDLSYKLSCLKEAVLINPKRSEASFELSELYQSDGRLSDAITVLNEFIKTNPCKPVLSKAYCKRAGYYINLGEYEDALQDLENVNNNDYHKYCLKGICYAKLGLNKSFKETLKDAFKESFYCFVKPAWSYFKSTRKNKQFKKIIKKLPPPKRELKDCLMLADSFSEKEEYAYAICAVNDVLQRQKISNEIFASFLAVRGTIKQAKEDFYGAAMDFYKAKNKARKYGLGKLDREMQNFIDDIKPNLSFHQKLKLIFKKHLYT